MRAMYVVNRENKNNVKHLCSSLLKVNALAMVVYNTVCIVCYIVGLSDVQAGL